MRSMRALSPPCDDAAARVQGDGHADDPKVARARAQLRAHCSFVKVLGSYPNVE